MTNSLQNRVQALVDPLLEEDGVELVDLQVQGGGSRRLIRALIHLPGGVSVEDCRRISRRIEGALDEEDVFQDAAYTLEVASPGLDRPLISPRDFERRIGETIRLELTEAIEGKKRWKGTIESVQESVLVLRPVKSDPLLVPFEHIRRGKIIV